MDLGLYMDCNATTPLHPEVASSVSHVSRDVWGNASNRLHPVGAATYSLLKETRATLASMLGCEPDEIIFTSGATEANNLLLQGLAHCYRLTHGVGGCIITSGLEHASVHEVARELHENNGFEWIQLELSADKRISVETLEAAMRDVKGGIRPDIVCISIIHANNEVGHIQDIEALSKYVKSVAPNVPFHSDMTQSIGKHAAHVCRSVDAVSFSGHKFQGPKGVGVLMIRAGILAHWYPLSFGGGQEGRRRPGTENLPNVFGLVHALRVAWTNRVEKNARLNRLREHMLTQLQREFPGMTCLTGCPDFVHSLPNTLSIALPDSLWCNYLLVKECGKRGLCLSVGSACSTAVPLEGVAHGCWASFLSHKHSRHVLDCLHVPTNVQDRVIRISLGDWHTFDDIDRAVTILCDVLRTACVTPPPPTESTPTSEPTGQHEWSRPSSPQ